MINKHKSPENCPVPSAAEKKTPKIRQGLVKIISGGQTGADRAALDAAIQVGIPHGGWLPRGRKTEDGPLSSNYALLEMDSPSYKKRTEKNVIESDATLIISFGSLTGGSALTESFTIKHNRPCLVLDLHEITMDDAAYATEKWLRKLDIAVLNVAGPRASGQPFIYNAAKKILLTINWNSIDKTKTNKNHD